MRRTIFGLALLAALALPAANATHEESDCEVTSTQPDVDVVGVLYVDRDTHWPEYFWIYQESNGVPGLQRGDEIEKSETCGHGPDTIVF